MTALETYLPLAQVVGFLFGWVACALVGLLIIQINR